MPRTVEIIVRRSTAGGLVIGLLAIAGCGNGVGSDQTPVVPTGNVQGDAAPESPLGGDATAPSAGSGAPPQAEAGTYDATAPSRADAGTREAAADGAGGAPVLPSSCLPTASLKPGDTNESLSVGSVTRTYILHVPNGYTGKTPVPFVIDFHPLFGTGSSEESTSGYSSLADQEGFVVAFPDGIDNAWNIGPCCTTSRTVDDIGFAKAVIVAVAGAGCIDPKRVYATGWSMGGGMSYYLACNAADTFAAIAPASFNLLEASQEPCAPARPVPEISFRDTGDQVVPYDGGATQPPNGLPITIDFVGAHATFQKWAQLDGCSGAQGTDGNGCATYTQCADGADVTLCTIQGGSHSPGNAQQGWAFMKGHSLP